MAARVRGLAAVVCLLLVASSCGFASIPHGVPAGSFVGITGKSITLVNAGTGEIERILSSTKKGRLTADTLTLHGHVLFVSYTKGPDCSSGVAGCGPTLGTCGGEVDRIDILSGDAQVIWEAGRDTVLAGAVPSPDDSRVVARTSPCVPSYFNQHLVVRDLAAGAEHTLGAALPRCHVLNQASWTGDGKHLVVLYGAATGRAPYTGSDGTCSASGPTHIVELDASRGQPGMDGLSRPAREGCSYESLASRGSDVYAVSVCEASETASLQRLDDNLVPGRSWVLGSRESGSALAISSAGDVLVAAYEYRTPSTVLSELSGGTLTKRISAHVGGDLYPGNLTW